MKWKSCLTDFPKKNGMYDTYIVYDNLILWLKLYFNGKDHKWIDVLGKEMNMMLVGYGGKFRE